MHPLYYALVAFVIIVAILGNIGNFKFKNFLKSFSQIEWDVANDLFKIEKGFKYLEHSYEGTILKITHYVYLFRKNLDNKNYNFQSIHNLQKELEKKANKLGIKNGQIDKERDFGIEILMRLNEIYSKDEKKSNEKLIENGINQDNTTSGEPYQEIRIIPWVPKIDDTEAHISDGRAAIVKMSGTVGEDTLRLYRPIDSIGINNYKYYPFLGINLYVDKDSNMLRLISNEKRYAPLRKNDIVFFYFKDGSLIEKKLPVGRVQDGRNVHAFVILSNYEFIHFSSSDLIYVSTSYDNGIKFSFLDHPNKQYSSIDEGQNLLKIIINRLGVSKHILQTQI